METLKEKTITVETTVNAPIEKIWSYWTEPDHITRWYYASEDWQAPYAENDLKVKGRFKTKMAAKDGSAGFDFEGVYTKVLKHKSIEYTIPDGRKVIISFSKLGNGTRIVESFEAEKDNSNELQKGGWQAILNNFKKYSESKQLYSA
jgi:uncharacterized protein YndB with AHSA1/START domain